MTHTDRPTDPIPTPLRDFLAASIVHDADTAMRFVADDAVVVDQGETFRRHDDIHAFLRDAGAEFTYTTEQIGSRRIDDTHWVVTLRLEGTFPGGLADLDYRFTLRDDRIAELVIANHEA